MRSDTGSRTTDEQAPFIGGGGDRPPPRGGVPPECPRWCCAGCGGRTAEKQAAFIGASGPPELRQAGGGGDRPPPRAGLPPECARWCCAGCGCCVLTVAVLVAMLLPGMYAAGFSWIRCVLTFGGFSACSSAFESRVALLPVGANGVPLGYFLSGVLWPDRPDVFNSSSIEGWAEVRRVGSQLPRQTWDGVWWRGNELGYIVNNPLFWSGSGIVPASIGLGSTMQQHAAIRPFLEKMFATDSEDDAWIEEELAAFLLHREAAGGMQLPGDLQRLAHQLLYRHVFGSLPTWDMAASFVAMQDSILRHATISQGLPRIFYGLAGYFETEREMRAYVHDYMVLLEAKLGDNLTSLVDECAPSPNCSLQLASAVVDALYAAGGFSLPTGIQSGLALLYSTSATNPCILDQVPVGKETEFFLETIRFVPPVYGLPYWTRRPTCMGLSRSETAALNATDGNTQACPVQPKDGLTGYAPVNQWQGGRREVVNMLTAQHDASVWGADALQFTVREMSEYEEKFVGFAEFASDPSVASGKNDRNCPGKGLAIKIGSAFFKAFDTAEWAPDDADIYIDPDAPFVQIEPSKLLPV